MMINSSFSNSVSALNTQSVRMNNAGHNIANVNTVDFVPKEPIQTSASEVSFKEKTNHAIPGQSRTRLNEEIPEMMISSKGDQANMKNIKVQDEMMGDLLDIVG
jgi:flagellar hook-associated protein FlgK